jgi:hypothetical protein
MAVDKGSINWRREFDSALDEARQQRRYTLLDFSAAPM